MSERKDTAMDENALAQPSGDRLQNNSDKVGYQNPPKHTQFKPGVSGNPSGRPRKKNLPSEVNDVRHTFKKVFGIRIKANVGGENRDIDGMETAFWVLRSRLSKGELPAVRLFIDFCKHFKITDPNEPNPQLKGLFDALMAGPVKTPGDEKL
jgi:Family of unknown function (DUF5681)